MHDSVPYHVADRDSCARVATGIIGKNSPIPTPGTKSGSPGTTISTIVHLETAFQSLSKNHSQL